MLFRSATILSNETDPNRLHDLKSDLDRASVYQQAEIDSLVTRFLDGERVDTLHPLLDICVARYCNNLDESGQVQFKGKSKDFTRTYDFLASILPYSNADWEKLSIFLNLLVPKLPAPMDEDLSKGIINAIDMGSYRAEKQATMRLILEDKDAEIDPIPPAGAGQKPEPELEPLSEIIRTFNDKYGTNFSEDDHILTTIKETIAPKVMADEAYRNARENTPNTAAMELEKAIERAKPAAVENMPFHKQYIANEAVKSLIKQMVKQLLSQQVRRESA